MRWQILLLAAVVAASGCVHADTPEPEPDTEMPPEQQLGDTSPADSPPESNTIYLTSSGFQPSELTVQQGETVTWVNNASSPMWVASNRHPTHTNYAGSTLREHCQNGDQSSAAFDQCSAGDEFSFTFEKTGDWGYHNHENPGQGGTITVE